MNTMINMVVALEKELDLERQGMRRTRRYIGDVRQITDTRWYQAGKPAAEAGYSPAEVKQLAEAQARREASPLLLARLFQLSRMHHQTTGDEC